MKVTLQRRMNVKIGVYPGPYSESSERTSCWLCRITAQLRGGDTLVDLCNIVGMMSGEGKPAFSQISITL